MKTEGTRVDKTLGSTYGIRLSPGTFLRLLFSRFKMKTRPVLPLLGYVCQMLVFLGMRSQGKAPEGCTLGDMIMIASVPFPDIEEWAADSYQMTVEFTIPGVSLTRSYTEFYDISLGKGRVDWREDGKDLQYIYHQKTWEAWNIEGDKCELQNVTNLPNFLKDYQMNWVFAPNSTQQQYRTVGPSAMFKLAYQQWNSDQTGKKRSMAYLGELHGTIRGIRAQAWRWCQIPHTTVDYFFTVTDTNKARDPKSVRPFPLRVAFKDRSPFEAALSEQYHDIVDFQPYISPGVHPFQLPRGKNCQRGGTLNPPTLPDYSTKSILFSAEVLYKRVRTKGVKDMDSFYSNIRLAVDQESQTLSYSYSPWNSTKDRKDEGEGMTENIIYDIQYGYVYRTDYETSQCTISRDKMFIPVCALPQDGESISLIDPFILFPNNEFAYLTTGYDRGREVNIFEVFVENYLLGEDTIVKKAIITQSYLTDNEIPKNNFEMKNAPTQIELRLFRTEGEEEVFTLNFLSFSTNLQDKRRLFDITRCFRNDDDYSWVTLGFESAGSKYVDLSALPVSGVERSILSYLDVNVNVKPMRVPVVMVDTKKELLYISLLLLEKPPSLLDFTYREDDKTIVTSDMQGLADLNTCATACLEQRKNCWGFAMCGRDCFYGTSPNSKVTTQKGCILHKRFNNETYLESKDSIIRDMQRQIEEATMKLTLDVDGTLITLKATHIVIADPA